MDQGRDLLGYLGDRTLDLSDELEEGCHRTEGDGLCCDAGDSPGEGCDVACGEAEGDHRTGEEVVVVPVDGLLLEAFLVSFKGVDRVTGALEG